MASCRATISSGEAGSNNQAASVVANLGMGCVDQFEQGTHTQHVEVRRVGMMRIKEFRSGGAFSQPGSIQAFQSRLVETNATPSRVPCRFDTDMPDSRQHQSQQQERYRDCPGSLSAAQHGRHRQHAERNKARALPIREWERSNDSARRDHSVNRDRYSSAGSTPISQEN
jgi:hypothetical protein